MSGFPVLSHFTSLSPKSYIAIISGIFRYFHLILKLLLEFPFLHLFILVFLCYDRTDCYENNLFISLERSISMNFITKSWKGILLCLVIAVPCWFLGQTFPDHRRTGIRYPCRNDHHFIIKRQIHVSGRYYFCVKEGSSVRCNPSRFRTESLRDSGNRKTVTANYRNDDFNVSDHCISVT